MFRFVFCLSVWLACAGLQAQEKMSIDSGSVQNLEEVKIQAYGANTAAFIVPASIAVLSKRDLNRHSTYSLLPSFNSVSGVRLEERSPGSYRLSIRGSLLRSPFGVRNVKVYLDDFILTDAGGNSYLNLLDVASLGGAEIIKGPAGSIYGAGTGGALLLKSAGVDSRDSAGWKINIGTGSYSTLQESVQYQARTPGMKLGVTQSHFQSSGYRDHSGIRKDLIQVRAQLQSSALLQTDLLVLYSDLNYKTPGGLTLAQLSVNPRQSRPATPVLPSARDQQAQVFNKTFLVGISNRFFITEKWKLVNAITTSVTDFRNPFITNYEKRKETNLGWRSTFQYDNLQPRSFQWTAGVEWQLGRFEIDSSGNNRGVADLQRVRDKVKADQLFVFSQVRFRPTARWDIEAGLSTNSFGYSVDRVIGAPQNINWKFNPQVLPRLAISFIPINRVSLFVQFAKGFSAPTLAEVKPSAGGVFAGLQAESGWNKEVGIRLKGRSGRFSISSQVFQFNLRNAIVRQVNSGGAEYFINAGSVEQKGWETDLSWMVIAKRSSMVQVLQFKSAYTINDFNFKQYAPSGNRYDGNALTGVPDNILAFSILVEIKKGFFVDVNLNRVDRLPLNDANAFWSEPYTLIQSRVGWKGKWRKSTLEIFLLGDNLGNERYTLGHDINAFGNRFYNPAPQRNFLLGLTLAF